MGETMKTIKRILKWIGVIFGILAILGIARIGWGMYREPIAKQQALDFCGTIKIGQSIEGIAERAIESGAETRLAKWIVDPSEVRVMNVTFIGMPPFSRHICSIKADANVTSAKYEYLD
jgi:hypothetical protein